MAKIIKGEVVYESLEGGFWGIRTEEENYLPLNFPEQLKIKGALIECTIIEVDQMTFHNWGTPCHVISFSTLNS